MKIMTFTLEQFEFFLAIFARITAFVYTAPFFSINSVPQRAKIGISGALAYFVFTLLPYQPLEYSGSLGFLFLMAMNTIFGLALGMFGNICNQILSFSGQVIDMQIGFSMATEYDPSTRSTVSLTSNIYNYGVILIMLVSHLHYYIIEALIDTFQLVPLYGFSMNGEIYKLMLQFIVDFCVIGFRVALPIFAAILVTNTVLAILAKVAPQMNMFVIGMQLKVLIGLAVLSMVIIRLDSISDFIFDEMIGMMKQAIQYFR